MTIIPTIVSAQTSTLSSGQTPTMLSGELVITEIMYDVPGADTGREWVEVFNTSSNPVKLTAWKLFENGTKHKIVAASGVDTLVPNTYAVIADNPAAFRADWPQFSGVLFDSVFSLGNSGDTIALYDASSTEISSVSYQSSWGAAGDGNSLNRVPGDTGAFSPHTPSPGAPISTSVIPPPAPKQTVAAPSLRTRTQTSKNPVHATTGTSNNAIIGDVAAQEDPTPSNDSAPVSQTATPFLLVSSKWWWIGASALALLGAGAMFISRSKAKNEWEISEAK